MIFWGSSNNTKIQIKPKSEVYRPYSTFTMTVVTSGALFLCCENPSASRPTMNDIASWPQFPKGNAGRGKTLNQDLEEKMQA